MNIQKLRQIYNQLQSEFADEEIYPKDFLDFSVRIYIHEEISEERGFKKPSFPKKQDGERKPTFRNPNSKASKPTLDYLQKLGYQGTLDLTQKEASTLIDEYKAQKSTEGY